MTPTLERIVTAHGTFPDVPQVLEGFAAVLDAANSGREPAADVTAALLALVDQLAEQFQRVPAEIGARLTDWAQRAATDPSVPATSIVALLVNAGTTRAEAVLEELTAKTDRPELAEAAAEGLAELRAPAPPAAPE